MERQNMLKKIAGLTLPEGQNTSSNGTAAELLSSVLKSAPEKITLLTLGRSRISLKRFKMIPL